jgi:hypothetical protein
MVKRKTTINKTLHRKLQIEQHEPTRKGNKLIIACDKQTTKHDMTVVHSL